MDERLTIGTSRNFRAYIFVIIAMIIWGGSWPLGRWMVSEDVGGETIPPLMIGVLRYFIVVIVFLVLLRIKEKSLNISRVKDEWKTLSWMGLTSVTIYQIGYLYGELNTAASDASLIVASNPIWVFILSGLFLDEGFSWKKITGVFVAFVGVLFIVGFSPNENVPNRLLGDLLILFAALGYSTYTVLYRHYINTFDKENLKDKPSSLFVITWVSLFGFLFTFPIAIIVSPEYLNLSLYLQTPTRIWYGLAYLAFLSTILAYWLYLEAIKRLNASRTAIFVNLIPVFGVSFSAIFLNELIDPIVHSFSFLLIFFGIFLVNRANAE